MNSSPDFIGIGVEKAGTSWIFACLYEHPEICIPQKEINFFTKNSLWRLGQVWYEDYFNKRCSIDKTKGEFSTEYFYNPECPARIKSLYPDVKLILCLRDPITRAYSGYVNAIKAGRISPQTSFEKAIKMDHTYLEQGKYKVQINRYLQCFDQSQILILIYEDIETDPLKFIQTIYHFLKINSAFIPDSLNTRINISRIPENLAVENWSNKIAAKLQQSKVGEHLWWRLKKSKLPTLVRKFNTSENNPSKIHQKTYIELRNYFDEDVTYIENLTGRKLNWLSEKND